MYKHYVKRFLDVVISIIGLVVLSPICVITAVAIKLDSKGPIIFKQDRLGKAGHVFKLFKFRSMCINAEQMGSGQYSYKGDARVTRVGRLIRAMSIDELPQFVNILKGDMSIIGFRPPLTYHPWPYSQYTNEQKKMFQIRPGITGWAQVNGRKTITWDKRIEMSVWYVEHITFLLDIRIFLMTILKVLSISNNENISVTVSPSREYKQ